MIRLRNNRDSPWCLLGDTNIVIKQEEKVGGNIYDLVQANWLINFMEECSLLEMHLLGGPFSWINQRSDEDAIMERLDRFLFNSAWSEMFNKATGFLEPAIGSDHCPLVCNSYGSSKRRNRDFRFESKWLLEDECKQVVNNAWKLSRG
ncbi:hypothetical protein V6N13_143438 [Hibiscus sabdariffa]|uniref:Endonuclease/exonuclease/phosphatase domain-containing protein n=1 Tax=Hibiscus sabdariffa TaxID=183260 RepID=A0ABR2FHR2_9ROSI